MADAYSIEETPETKSAFAQLIARLNRLTTSDVKPVSDAIKQGFAENFENESAGGKAWSPLAPATVRDRISHGFGGEHKILQRTQSYLNSFQGGGEHIETVTPEIFGATIEVGSRHRLTEFHESGTSRMPARPVTILSQQAERRVFDEIDKLFLHLLTQND